jgi:GT2 family glycosyltransferase
MRIDGKDYTINIVILTMSTEIKPTISTIKMLMGIIEDGVSISLLLNGGSNKELSDFVKNTDNIHYYESENNLGVAGGRNFLFTTKESKKADFIFILDNDIIPSVDCIRNLASFLLKHPNAGIVGPMVANAACIPCQLLLKNVIDKPNFNVELKFYSRDIKNAISKIQSNEQLTFHLYHIGIHYNYHRSYFSSIPYLMQFFTALLKVFGIYKNNSPILINNTSYLNLIREKKIDVFRVSNVIGAGQFFRRNLLDEIGFLDERFNPYGYEDVDFSIRSIKKGYINMIDVNTWIFHGTDDRHARRDVRKRILNKYSKLTLLVDKNFKNLFKRKLIIYKIFISELFILMIMSFSQIKIFLDASLKGINNGQKLSKMK